MINPPPIYLKTDWMPKTEKNEEMLRKILNEVAVRNNREISRITVHEFNDQIILVAKLKQ